MKKEYVVLIFSIVVCLMLGRIVLPSESDIEIVEVSPPQIKLSAVLEPVEREVYEDALYREPTIRHEDLRSLKVEFSAYGVDSNQGDVVFVEPYKLEQLLLGEGLQSPLSDYWRDGVVRRGDRGIASSYQGIVNLGKMDEVEFLQRIDSYPLRYQLIGLNGESVQLSTTLGEILEVKDAGYLESPQIEVTAHMVPMTENQMAMPRNVFHEKSLEPNDVMKIKIRLRGARLGDLQQRDIFFLNEELPPANEERIYWYATGEGRNDLRVDDAFYYQDGVVNIKGLNEQEVRDLFQHYNIAYQLQEADGTLYSADDSLGDLLVWKDREEFDQYTMGGQ